MGNLTDTQPTNINHLNVVNFEVNFSRLPATEYFCQRVSIPAVMLGSTVQPTSFLNIPVEGETLSFEALNLSFILDEDLKNYLEIYNWMLALGFPQDYSQFSSLKDPRVVSEYASMFSDMDIFLHTNKSNPNYKVTFNDVFPTSLGSIELNTTVTSLEPIIIDATFNFKGMFKVEKIT